MESDAQLFIWSTDFTTDIGIVDEQHQKLIDMINTAVKLSLETGPVRLDTVTALQANLGEYVVYHFGTEQTMMESFGVDMRHQKTHRIAHENFTNYVRSFFLRNARPERPELRAFAEYLIRWLAYHILNLDKTFARQIRSIQDGASPEQAYEKERIVQETTAEPLLKALQGLFFIVAEKNLQLEKANAELETKVRERTGDLETANRKLALLAVEDELTKLPNRRYALGTLDRLSKEFERYQRPFGVIMLDADRFKAVNDQYGHEYGDKVIRWIADFLVANTRKTDVVARLGGDEFLVICPQTEIRETRILAESLRRKAAAFNEKSPLPWWNVSFSLGVAGPNGAVKSIKTILARADKAMYKDKIAVRN